MTAETKFASTPAEDTEITLKTAGQRKVNLIWEFTQAFITVAVTMAIIYCQIYNIDSAVLTNAFFLIVGFYFSRTNHTAIGGIGSQIKQPYEGR